jgi:CheY-like chemotaxis protein
LYSCSPLNYVALFAGVWAQVGEFMRAASLGFAATVLIKGVKLEQDNDPQLPLELIGDALRLRQVLNNFVSNALKFTGEGGCITLKSRLVAFAHLMPPEASGQPRSASNPAVSQAAAAACTLESSKDTAGGVATVEFSVTDTGIGIAPEDQRKLFQAFSQVRAGELQSGRGSGLGLSICKHMVHLMGGSIGVRSRPGHGSTFFFTVSLPVAAAGSAEALRHSALCVNGSFDEKIKAERVSKCGGGKSGVLSTSRSVDSPRTSLGEAAAVQPLQVTALIVDDVTTNRKMIKRCVQQLGFACDEACDGAEAVAMCAAKQYSLVLMDNVMPRMNGMEATAAIRRDHAVSGWGGTRIFGLTGNALAEDVAEFQHSGCDEVLTKPLRIDHLKRVLAEYGLFNDALAALGARYMAR